MAKTPKTSNVTRLRPPAKVQREYKAPTSTGEARAFFLEAMVAVARDEMDHAKAQNIARLGQQAYNFSKLELRAAEISARYGTQIIQSWEFHVDPPQAIDQTPSTDENNNDTSQGSS